MTGVREHLGGAAGYPSPAMGGAVPLPYIESDVVKVPKFTIAVYLNDGQVFEYDVASMAQAREHVSAIIERGYRSVQAESPNVLTHYPPHRISKVKITGNQSISTSYTDRVRGT